MEKRKTVRMSGRSGMNRPQLTLIRPEGEVAYIGGSESLPAPLTREEEQALFERMDEEPAVVRRTLIEHNLRLVAHVAKKYYATGVDPDDLVSIGTVGLIKGVSTYRSGTGTQLSTYCARCIENEILMCLRASQKRRGDVSLHEPIGVDGEGNEITLSDVLGTEEGAVHEAVERRVSLETVRRLVTTQLYGRERTVLEMRYGLLDGQIHPQQEIARQLGVSRSYVSRIEKRAMERLQRAFEGGAAGQAPEEEPVKKNRIRGRSPEYDENT